MSSADDHDVPILASGNPAGPKKIQYGLLVGVGVTVVTVIKGGVGEVKMIVGKSGWIVGVTKPMGISIGDGGGINAIGVSAMVGAGIQPIRVIPLVGVGDAVRVVVGVILSKVGSIAETAA